MNCSPLVSFVHGDSPGKNTRVGCPALFQGIFPTQGSNPGLLQCRWVLYHLSHKRSPRTLEWVAYPFSRGSSQPRISCIAGGFFTNWAIREALIGRKGNKNLGQVTVKLNRRYHKLPKIRLETLRIQNGTRLFISNTRSREAVEGCLQNLEGKSFPTENFIPMNHHSGWRRKTSFSNLCSLKKFCFLCTLSQKAAGGCALPK